MQPLRVVTAEAELPFWDLLAAYANADIEIPVRLIEQNQWLDKVPCHKSPFDRLAHLLLCSGLVDGLLHISVDFDPAQMVIEDDRTAEIFRATSAQLNQHYKEFREVLLWLCSGRVGRKPFLRTTEVRGSNGLRTLTSPKEEQYLNFLESHGLPQMRLYVRSALQKSKRRFVLYPSRWQDAVDPFCAFLIQQCASKTFANLPVKLCRKRKCGRFFVQLRSTGKFCSTLCKAQNH
jgi:hypothetical protein